MKNKDKALHFLNFAVAFLPENSISFYEKIPPLHPKPVAIVSVTSDLSTDQRVNRTCIVLQKQGFEVLLAGRQLPESPALQKRSYATKRFRLLFTRGPLFYAGYNIRLFFFLLFKKADLFFSNDLDTLPANYLASLIRRKPLVYDSHEYYTGVPELENRPLIKKIWKIIEGFILPKLKIIITVNDSIAKLYGKEYGKKLIVIRNVPFLPQYPEKAMDKNTLRRNLGLPLSGKILILQGAGINIHRGAEEAVEAMNYLDDTTLLIVGGGDVINLLQQLVKKSGLESKVIFKPRMPYHEMMAYTTACDIGLTFDKDTNINYRYSLPNKIFDYIHAGIPVVASRLPELEKIISGYNIGAFIENHDPEHIAARIKSILADTPTLAGWKKNLQLASAELNWETEEKKFPHLMNELNG